MHNHHSINNSSKKSSKGSDFCSPPQEATTCRRQDRSPEPPKNQLHNALSPRHAITAIPNRSSKHPRTGLFSVVKTLRAVLRLNAAHKSKGKRIIMQILRRRFITFQLRSREAQGRATGAHREIIPVIVSAHAKRREMLARFSYAFDDDRASR